MSSVVRARIDDKLKDDAEAVLEAQGLSVSDAIRLMMVRIAAEGKLPFDPYTPNSATIEAIKAARRGELTTVTIVGLDTKPLLDALSADD